MARDMTQGNITKHLLLYAGPLIIGDLFQQLYHTVDSVVVGQFRGKEALAAIGAAGPVMNILIFMIAGISMGASILMAEYYGAKKYEDLKEEMATSIGAGLLLTLVLSLLFYAGSGLFIRLTQTPEEISHMAAGYLRIISAGLIFTFFYNILAAALRAIGDSRTSLCVLILTTIINVVLDIIFVRNLDLGVYGAAWATVIAQAVSSLALILYIYIKVPVLRLKPSEIHINLKLLKKTADYSSVSALQQTMLYLGRLQCRFHYRQLCPGSRQQPGVFRHHFLGPEQRRRKIRPHSQRFWNHNVNRRHLHCFCYIDYLVCRSSSVWDIPETVGTKCHCAGTFLYPSHGLFLFYGRNDSHVPGILPGYRQVKVHFNRHLNPDPGPCHTDLWADLTA